MRVKDFVAAVVDQYEQARDPIATDDRVKRGTSRSISGITEDLFAQYLAEVFTDEALNIYVDQNFTVTDEEGVLLKKKNQKALARKRRSFRPDIAFVKNNVVMAIFDVKQDLGWMRNQTQADIKQYDNVIDFLQGEDAILTRKNKGEPNIPVTFSEHLVRQFVVVSSLNISPDRLDANIQLFKEMKFNRVSFLTEGEVHPNSYDYDKDVRKKMVYVNSATFDCIAEFTRRQIELSGA